MKPFRTRVDRVIDFGAIMSLIGIDAETKRAVTVHVDYRPFDVVWAAWQDVGSKQPIEYAADGLTLDLGLPADDQMIRISGHLSVRPRLETREAQAGSARRCRSSIPAPRTLAASLTPSSRRAPRFVAKGNPLQQIRPCG